MNLPIASAPRGLVPPLTVVSWNLQRKGEPTWKYLRDKLEPKPDVILVQEATIPAWAGDYWKFELAPKRRHHAWGCAILTRLDWNLEPHPPGANTPWLSRLTDSSSCPAVFAR